MKKSLKNLVYLLIAVPILFIGCKKSDLTDGSNTKGNIVKDGIAPVTPVYCGQTKTANLYFWWDEVATSYGTVTVGNDLNNLYVTYTLTGDWTLLPEGVDYYNGCYLFVGSQAELDAKSTDNYNINSTDFTGHFDFLGFKHYTPVATGEKTYMYTIPRSEITVDCPMIVAFAGITNGTTHQYVSAKSLLKGMGYWFNYCMQACNHETAYARGLGGGNAFCFYDAPLNLKNWGWTNVLVPTTGEFSWPIYYGNPSCVGIESHLVGHFTGTYDGTTLHVMYDLLPGYTLEETHLWVNADYMYKQKGKYVASPGKYTYNNVFEEGVYKDFPATGTIYVAAHAVVGW